MKVVAINGSPRRNGNTSLLIEETFKIFQAEGIETEVVQLGNKPVHGCTACGKCREIQDRKCHIKNDLLNLCIEKMIEADGIILGTPVYFADVSTEIKALMDVAGYVTRGNGHLLKRKVGAGVISVRRGGALPTFDTINRFFLINQMIVPGSSYWNFAFGKNKGDVLQDEEGINTIRTLAENMSWLMKKIKED
ncbi:Multimeric flavodoxin WrbA [Draconibacterium orientale]|jgi:multimeric flavodoxin WrbA|uniref:FMN reductase n=1 Tax=Draconibacterium orientale TaxID=1168034 RepID=X5DCU7_9BACT|nr:flavodoxin family protein [Draconibacterium orientale]AHW60668.1 FMN reductase [Draconibacterium orientale]SET78343.1 Multimeric flavodoxin WrbA [Draconibacterium orientale]